MQKLLNIPIEDLMRTDPEIIKDYLIMIRTGTSLSSWSDDLKDDPGLYHYSADELEQFLFLIQN